MRRNDKPAARKAASPQGQNSSPVPLRDETSKNKVKGDDKSSAKMTPAVHSTAGTEAAAVVPNLLVKVAIVEDDVGLRRSLERLLNLTPGFRCIYACGSGEEAMKLIPANPPDVVLMDIHLPNRSGIECAAFLRQRVPELQIIMLTAYDDAHTIFKALRAGASGYLLKRARPEAIFEAIHEARRGGAPMSSEIARQVVAAFQEPPPAGTVDEGLSRREQEILEHLLRGFSNKDIAAQLSISIFTVKNHLRHIYEKLHVRSRTDVLLKYRDTLGEGEAKPFARHRAGGNAP
jgi:DNA-binding NarL/FixJ family response regulator